MAIKSALQGVSSGANLTSVTPAIQTIELVIQGYIYGTPTMATGANGTAAFPTANAASGNLAEGYLGPPSATYWDPDYLMDPNIVGYRVQALNNAPLIIATGIYPVIVCNNWEYRNMNYQPSVNQRLNDGNIHNMMIHIPWTILNINWALFLIKGGIQIILELDDPNRVLISGVDPGYWSNSQIAAAGTVTSNTSCSMSYTITSPRFLAMMSTPEPSQMRNYVSRWNSDSGLVYYCAGLKIQKISYTGNETDSYLRFNMGVRSCRRMWLGITSQHYSEASDALTACVDSFATYLKTSAQYFQVAVGSHFFPLRRLQVDDLALEAHWYWRAINGDYAPISATSIEAYEWSPQDRVYNTINTSGQCQEATKFMFTMDFSRSDYQYAYLTGIDLSIVPLDVTINRYSGHGSQFSGLPSDVPTVYVCCVQYDMFIRMSSQQISVLA